MTILQYKVHKVSKNISLWKEWIWNHDKTFNFLELHQLTLNDLQWLSFNVIQFYLRLFIQIYSIPLRLAWKGLQISSCFSFFFFFLLIVVVYYVCMQHTRYTGPHDTGYLKSVKDILIFPFDTTGIKQKCTIACCPKCLANFPKCILLGLWIYLQVLGFTFWNVFTI